MNVWKELQPRDIKKVQPNTPCLSLLLLNKVSVYHFPTSHLPHITVAYLLLFLPLVIYGSHIYTVVAYLKVTIFCGY